jgi:putative Mg2+ transporter-C (MgtC) family protein
LTRRAWGRYFTPYVRRERERDDQSAGVRTFPIVAISSCAFVILTNQVVNTPDAQSRALQGLIMGIGFIGGGAIVKDAERVRGTATAAGIWATSVAGAAAGYGRFELAILVGVVTYLTLRLGKRLDIGPHTDKRA